MARRRRAERKKVKLRLAIMGASGSGKTFSALRIATGLVGGRTGDTPPKIILIDTENGSGELYSGDFDYDYEEITPPYTAQKIIDLIKDVETDYDIIIVDSLTHFWAKSGGILELKDNKLKTGKFKNEFTVWGDLTPIQNSIIDAILQSKAHVICTMRSKTEYTVEVREVRGEKKAVPKAIGLAPEQRPGIEYEFMITFDVSKEDHYAYALKDRSRLFDEKSFIITEDTGKEILTWLETGAEPLPETEPTTATQPASKPKRSPLQAKFYQKYAELGEDKADKNKLREFIRVHTGKDPAEKPPTDDDFKLLISAIEFYQKYIEYGEDPKEKDTLTAFVLDCVGKDPFAEALTDEDYLKLTRQIATLEKEKEEKKEWHDKVIGENGEKISEDFDRAYEDDSPPL